MARPDYPASAPQGLMWATASDPDNDGDNDSTPQGDTDHDYWSTDGKPMSAQVEGMRKGAPFAGYSSFSECVAQNQDKRDPSAYCGSIKNKVEGMYVQAASGLPQIQQHTDPNNQPAPEDDELPAGVAFPLGDNSPASSFGQQWSTGPDGPQPRTGAKAGMEEGLAEAMAHADVSNGRGARHQDDFGSNAKQHGKYLRAWNNLAGLVHGLTGRAAMSKDEYGKQTGRPDLHSHYLTAYAQGYARNHASEPRADDEGQTTASLRTRADSWTAPHQTTDDYAPPFNSGQTSPEPWSQQQGGDFQAGVSAGQSDRTAGERPLFADNSSAVSPYVSGYAQGYGAAGGPSGPQDVPRSMGGDSGQGANAGEAQRAFQVARASRTASAQDPWKDARDNLERQHDVRGGHAISGAPGDEQLEGEGTGGRSSATWKTSSLRRVSAAFAPDSLMDDPEFRKGYLFASRWQQGQRLAGKGSAPFEAGLYAGITDRPQAQRAWAAAHGEIALRRHPELAERLGKHASFSHRHAALHGGQCRGAYLQAQAGTSTDLITDGPGTSPDPMGSTPLNGPGTVPEMAGGSQPARSGGAPPYQGAPPLPGGPVVSDDVMGQAQSAPHPSGPFTNTFSGDHQENAVLAPVADNEANQHGYSNADSYHGDPHGGDRVAKLANFRQTVQANLVKMQKP